MRNLIILGILLAVPAWAGPYVVGNGDDGTDLEGPKKLNEGPIVEARKEAIELLSRLNTAGIANLGTLVPEVATADLYMTQKDSHASLSADQGAFHSDMRGLVFARTFAQPHAATRFFPIAERLDRAQLVSLHIHEALHRALPASVRENEATVSSITLAITSPQANHDEISLTIAQLVPEEAKILNATGAGSTSGSANTMVADKYPIPEHARVNQPSVFGYTYTQFNTDPAHPQSYPINRMHTLQSYLYPFGSDRVPLGVGIEASMLNSDQGSQMGPLGLSARLRLWSGRGFDVAAFAQTSLNMLSADELKNSAFGRDLGTVGLSMRKDLKILFVENFLSYSFAGTSLRQIGAVSYRYNYGGVVGASSHVGVGISKLKLGGYAEVLLANDYGIAGGAFSQDFGRFRIVSGGPEVAWVDKDFSIGVKGKFLLDSTKDANFDFLGDLMGQGVAQGSLAGNLSVYF